MQVTFQTQRMVAYQVKNQTVIMARGQANQKQEQARAACDVDHASNVGHLTSI